MQRRIIATLILTLGLLLSFAPLSATQAQSDPRAVQVAVSSGSPSGFRQPGEAVHLWAFPSPEGMVFDRWSGDTAGLDDVYAAHAVLTVPKTNVRLRATYKDAPVWEAAMEVVSGTEVYYFFPPNHQGVVVFFHGAGGSAYTWTRRASGRLIENRIVAEDVVAAGYGVVAVESLNRAAKTWDTQASADTNPDVANVKSILESFRARGFMGASEPIFGLGMSNGGSFVSIVSQALGFKAQTIMDSAIVQRLLAAGDYIVPTIWCLSEKDSMARPETGTAQYGILKAQGVNAVLNVNRPVPVDPFRFWRIPGMTASDSLDFYSSMKSQGVLDEWDYLVSFPGRPEVERSQRPPEWARWQAYVEELDGGRLAGFVPSVITQLNAVYSEHLVYTDCDAKIVRFFDPYRGLRSQGVPSPLAVEAFLSSEGPVTVVDVAITNNSSSRVDAFEIKALLPEGASFVGASPAAVFVPSTGGLFPWRNLRYSPVALAWLQPAGLDPSQTIRGYQYKFANGAGSFSVDVRYWGPSAGIGSSGPIIIP